MGNTVVIRKNGNEEVFENVLGHQVGYSHIQVALRDGTQRIISNFDEIDVTLDEETSAKFKEDLYAMEHPEEAEKVEPPVKLATVKSTEDSEVSH